MGAQKPENEPKRRLAWPINLSIVIAALTIALVLIYPALQNWWQVRRDIQLLEAESTALEARNSQIQGQIDVLGTPEGIESRAREQFGWVMPDEQAVNIIGLSSQDSTTALPENVEPGSIKPELDWLTETIDLLLGYEYPSPPPAAPDDVIIGL